MPHWLRRLLKALFGWMFVTPSALPTPTAPLIVSKAAPSIPVPSPPQVFPPPNSLQPAMGEPELPLTTAEPPKYRLNHSLFNSAEKTFYRALVRDIGYEYQIFAKVHVGAIVSLINISAKQNLRVRQIWGKNFDFLICDWEKYQPLLAIELDDRDHKQYFDNGESTALKDWLSETTGLPLLRFEVQKSYSPGWLGERVRARLSQTDDQAEEQ